MADQNIGRLHVEITGDNSDLVEKLNESGQQLNKAAGKVADFSKNIGVLRQEYKRLSKESFVGKSAEEIKQVEMRLSSLRDEIGDYDARIKSLSQDPFQKAAEGVQQLSTMMAGAAGAATLFGGSEEKLNALMQKTIALIAIAEAAQTAADFSKQNAIGIFIKEKYAEIAARIREGLVIKTNTAATVAETGAKTGLSVVQKGLIALQNMWNASVAAFPGMIIIAAIAAIATGAVLLTRALKDSNKEFDTAQKTAENLALSIERINSANKFAMDTASKFGATQNELAKARIKEIDDEIKRNEELAKQYQTLGRETSTLGIGFSKRAKEAQESNKKILASNVELFREQQLLLAGLIGEEIKLRNDARENEIKAAKEAAAKRKADYMKFLADLYDNASRYTQKNPIDIQLNLEMPSAEELFGSDDEFIAPLMDRVINMTDMLNETITTGLNDITGGVAEAVGAMAGGAGIDTLFKGIGESIANFTSSLGKSLIAAGIGAMAFKKLLINPAAAIVAGAGLIAVSGFIRQKLSAGPGGGGSSVASSSSGTSEGVSANRTIFANDMREIKLSGEFRVEGNALVASIYNENKRITN